jgi:hypothetical protein
MSEGPVNARGRPACLPLAVIGADDGMIMTFRGAPLAQVAQRLQALCAGRSSIESRKKSMEVLVIDDAQPPTPN